MTQLGACRLLSRRAVTLPAIVQRGGSTSGCVAGTVAVARRGPAAGLATSRDSVQVAAAAMVLEGRSTSASSRGVRLDMARVRSSSSCRERPRPGHLERGDVAILLRDRSADRPARKVRPTRTHSAATRSARTRLPALPSVSTVEGCSSSTGSTRIRSACAADRPRPSSTNNLRVRSDPYVGPDSQLLEPLLDEGDAAVGDRCAPDALRRTSGYHVYQVSGHFDDDAASMAGSGTAARVDDPVAVYESPLEVRGDRAVRGRSDDRRIDADDAVTLRLGLRSPVPRPSAIIGPWPPSPDPTSSTSPTWPASG